MKDMELYKLLMESIATVLVNNGGFDPEVQEYWDEVKNLIFLMREKEGSQV